MVVALIGFVAVSTLAPKALNQKIAGMASRFLLLGIIAAAVITFT
jgi:hypothetical protein